MTVVLVVLCFIIIATIIFLEFGNVAKEAILILYNILKIIKNFFYNVNKTAVGWLLLLYTIWVLLIFIIYVWPNDILPDSIPFLSSVFLDKAINKLKDKKTYGYLTLKNDIDNSFNNFLFIVIPLIILIEFAIFSIYIHFF